MIFCPQNGGTERAYTIVMFWELKNNKNATETAKKICIVYPIYPTPPLRQDLTQGQFLSGV